MFSQSNDTNIKELIRILTPAIIHKYHIRFYYEDETDHNKHGFRIVEPHLIGIHKDSKEDHLSAYFLPTSAQLIQGFKKDWCSYLLSRMYLDKISVLETGYTNTRRFYNPRDKRMSQIICATNKN